MSVACTWTTDAWSSGGRTSRRRTSAPGRSCAARAANGSSPREHRLGVPRRRAAAARHPGRTPRAGAMDTTGACPRMRRLSVTTPRIKSLEGAATTWRTSPIGSELLASKRHPVPSRLSRRSDVAVPACRGSPSASRPAHRGPGRAACANSTGGAPRSTWPGRRSPSGSARASRRNRLPAASGEGEYPGPRELGLVPHHSPARIRIGALLVDPLVEQGLFEQHERSPQSELRENDSVASARGSSADAPLAARSCASGRRKPRTSSASRRSNGSAGTDATRSRLARRASRSARLAPR